MDTDFRLIRKMKQGNEPAFEVFVRKYYEDILKYCSYRCTGREYAEDLTQETFTHFFAKLSEYHHRGKIKNYLYTIAGNLCKDFYKKKQEIPKETMDIELYLEPEISQTDDIINKLVIERALQQLPEQLYEIVILYFFKNLKLTEVAGILQIGLPLAKYRVRQAKMQLKKLLQKEGMDESARTTHKI